MGYIDIVKFLVSHGADVNTSNDQPLRDAAENGHLEVVKFLISNGANMYTNEGQALRVSDMRGHEEVVKFLKAMHQMGVRRKIRKAYIY